MNHRTAFLALAMTAAVLVGIQSPTRAAPEPEVRPGAPVLLAAMDVDGETGSARLGDSLVFTGNSNGDYEPWITDGTPPGTHRIPDIGVGLSSERGGCQQ